MDLSQLSDAELSTLKTNLLATINSAATGAQSYSVDGRSLNRMDPEKAMRLLSAVNEEIRFRADDTGGLILTEFGEPL